jgi:hypothetical protein
MKKPLLIVIIILVVILALPGISLIRWTFSSKKPMNVLILDKTSSTIQREKHRSLTWILTNDRFVKKTNKQSYSYRKDYFGFVPTRPLREHLWDKVDLRLTNVFKFADTCDVLYIADTYGVYMNDWYKGINKSHKSRKLYGGINAVDFLYIKEFRDSSRLLIMEYNTFDYPTPDLEKYKITNQILGIKFDGWTGKYFSTLDTAAKGNEDFPVWMTGMYRKEYRKPWTFKKPGIVFLKDNDIIVLEEGAQLKSATPFIVTDSTYTAKYGVANKVAFDGWFDVIDPMANKIISKFKIETTSSGDSLLYENGIVTTIGLSEFPAVITDSVKHRTYYFSGDFASSKIPYWMSRFHGIDKLKGILYSDQENDTRRFFWLYYRPLLNGIFTDYYKSAVKSK